MSENDNLIEDNQENSMESTLSTRVKDEGFWREMWHQLQLVWRLIRSPDVPLYLKLLPALAVVYVLIRRSLVEPLKLVTRTVEEIAESRVPASMPEFKTREMSGLADAIARACRAHGVSI